MSTGIPTSTNLRTPDGNEVSPAGESSKAMRRRAFIASAAAGAAAATLAAPSAGSAQSASFALDLGRPAIGLPGGVSNLRILQAFNLRLSMATQDALLGPAVNVDNGDPARYPDEAGVFTKTLPHDAYGRVDPAAFATFQTALNSGKFSDFEKIVMGGVRTLNGPQGGLAFDMATMDSVQFGQPQVPPAPPLASDQSATELLEHYWASLLRDVAFTDYGSNPLAAQAAAELGSQSTYLGPRDSHGKVTPALLFRGAFPGETLGPYVSQFLLQPTYLGS
jgi:hypothetical protein